MARTSQTRERSRSQENGNRQRQNLSFSQNPVSDLMYDWITVLQAKAEGINAYEKYMRDAEQAGDMESADLFRKFREQDIWQVKEIKQQLEDVLLEAEGPRFGGRGMHMAGMRSGGEETEAEE